MKIRFNRDLYDAANVCAKAVDETFKDYVGIAVRMLLSGKLKQCSKSSELLTTTSASVVATINHPGQDADFIRLALLSAVEFVQSVTPAPFIPKEKYIIGGEFE